MIVTEENNAFTKKWPSLRAKNGKKIGRIDYRLITNFGHFQRESYFLFHLLKFCLRMPEMHCKRNVDNNNRWYILKSIVVFFVTRVQLLFSNFFYMWKSQCLPFFNNLKVSNYKTFICCRSYATYWFFSPNEKINPQTKLLPRDKQKIFALIGNGWSCYCCYQQQRKDWQKILNTDCSLVIRLLLSKTEKKSQECVYFFCLTKNYKYCLLVSYSFIVINNRKKVSGMCLLFCAWPKISNTACSLVIRLYLTPLGQARKFIENCGT